MHWSGWIAHDGSPRCPIPRAVGGQYVLRLADGSETESPARADQWDWRAFDLETTITHFRVLLDVEPDAEIEAVARQLCRERGLGPDDQVGGEEIDWLTDAEIAARFSDGPAFSYDGFTFGPRWRTYRREAAKAFAEQGSAS